MAEPEDRPICMKPRAGVGDFHDDERPVTMSAHGPMRRIYGTPEKVIMLDMTGYVEKAYRGEELPAGMSQPQVRAIVDAQVTRRRAGMANERRYRTLR